MEHDQLDPQIEKLLKEVQLKEPKRQEMTDYLSQVRSKITVKQNQTHFHFVPAGIVLVAILVLSGFIYWLIQSQSKEAEIPISRSLRSSNNSEIASGASHPRNDVPTGTAKDAVIARRPKADEAIPYSLEQEMIILEAFSDEYPNGTSDLVGDEETMEDLVLIDEIEFAVAPTQGTSFGS